MIVLIVLISMIRCIHSLVRTCPVFPTVLSGYCQVVTSQRWSPNIPIVHSLAGMDVQDGHGGVWGGSSNISVLNIALVCWAESQLDNNPGICLAWLHRGHLGYILLVLSFSASLLTRLQSAPLQFPCPQCASYQTPNGEGPLLRIKMHKRHKYSDIFGGIFPRTPNIQEQVLMMTWYQLDIQTVSV